MKSLAVRLGSQSGRLRVCVEILSGELGFSIGEIERVLSVACD